MLLPLLGFAAGTVWLWWMVLRKPRAGAATCGKCGYRVEGLTTMNCPECGGDFRQVGIYTPGTRKMLGPVWFTIAWLVLATPLALTLSLIPIRLATHKSTSNIVMMLQPVSPGAQIPQLQIELAGGVGGFGTSNGNVSLNGRLSSVSTISWRLGSPPKKVLLTEYAPPSNSAPALEIDPPTGTFAYSAPNGQRVMGDKITPDDLASWFNSAGILTPDQTGNDDTHAILVELAKALDAVARGNNSITLTRLEFTRAPSARGVSTTPWAYAVVAGLWVAVFLIGVAVYVLVRRRRRAAGELEGFTLPSAGQVQASAG